MRWGWNGEKSVQVNGREETNLLNNRLDFQRQPLSKQQVEYWQQK